MCKSAKKQFAELGIEVYEVGVKQVRGWFGWRGCKSTGRNIFNMAAMCDTMRKGAYLVVTGFACFGYMGQSVSIYGDGSVSSAVFIARKELEFNDWAVSDEYYSFSSGRRPRYQHDVEVWHLVDDGDLWHEWDCLSAQYIAKHDLAETAVVNPDYLTTEAYYAMGVTDERDMCSIPYYLKQLLSNDRVRQTTHDLLCSLLVGTTRTRCLSDGSLEIVL